MKICLCQRLTLLFNPAYTISTNQSDFSTQFNLTSMHAANRRQIFVQTTLYTLLPNTIFLITVLSLQHQTTATALNLGFFDTSHPKCHCDLPSIMMTCYTIDNPGRRYFQCNGFKTDPQCCSFFRWFDDEGNCRGYQASLILALYAENKKLKHNNEELFKKHEELSKKFQELRSENTILIVDSIERDYYEKKLPKYGRMLIWPSFIAFGVGILLIKKKK